MQEKDKMPSKALSQSTDFLLYKSEDANVVVRVVLRDDTIWLTQEMMAKLFGVNQPAIAKHLKNIFDSGELSQDSAHSILEYTAVDGKTYKTKFYNLDAVVSVGYRVNSLQATRFRIWATTTLREYIIKGFAMDDDRLKQSSTVFGKDYFRDLLERVRSIRASERRIYQQITDIFAECSIDYDRESTVTKDFYASVQNKFHFAITGQTAAEIVYDKANKTKPYMGLTTWKHSPEGRILKSDVSVAKNYLPAPEIRKLERTVSGFFDYIENIIENQKTMTMEDLVSSVDKFLGFNEYKVLDGKGSVSHKKAEKKAFAEYDAYNATQKIESDFDRDVAKQLRKIDGGKSQKDAK